MIFASLALAMIATVSAIRQDEEFQASWDENRKVQYLETHPGERERLLNEDRNLRDRYFQAHNEEAGEYYGRHREFQNEWHGAGGEAWNAGWDENRKIQYLEAHPGERERLLNEDRNLRTRYFQEHNDEAGEYYGRHHEFQNEWHGAGGEAWNAGWDENRKVQYLEAHPGERERLLNEDRNLRTRYFQAHADEEAGYYGHHPEFHAEFNGRGRKREVGRWNRF